MIRETNRNELYRGIGKFRAFAIFSAVVSALLILIMLLTIRGQIADVLLFIALPLVLINLALLYPLRLFERLVWKVNVSDTTLGISTLKQDHILSWESVADVQKCLNRHSFYYSLSLRDGTKFDLPAVLDSDGELLAELRKKVDVYKPATGDSQTEYKLPMQQQLGWLLGMPIVAWLLTNTFLAVIMGGYETARYKMEAVSGGLALSTFICCLMFVCRSLSTSKRGISIHTLLGSWECTWDSVKLTWGYLKTPAGVFPVWSMGNYDMFQADVRKYTLDNESKSIKPLERSRLKTLRSPWLAPCLLAATSLMVPLEHSIWVGVALLAVLFIDFVRPSRNLPRTTFCMLAAGITFWTIYSVSAVDRNQPVFQAFMVALHGSNTSSLPKLGKEERVQQYEITPLAMPDRYYAHISDSDEYVSLSDKRSLFASNMEQFFGVDDAPKRADGLAADSNTSPILEGAKWSEPVKVVQGGMHFNERKGNVTYEGRKVFSVEYVAIDNGKRVVYRVIGNQAEDDYIVECARLALGTIKKLPGADSKTAHHEKHNKQSSHTSRNHHRHHIRTVNHHR